MTLILFRLKNFLSLGNNALLPSGVILTHHLPTPECIQVYREVSTNINFLTLFTLSFSFIKSYLMRYVNALSV